MKKRILDLAFGDTVTVDGITGMFVGWTDKGIYCHLRRSDNGEIQCINVDGWADTEVETNAALRGPQHVDEHLALAGEPGLFDVCLVWEGGITLQSRVTPQDLVDMLCRCLSSSDCIFEANPFTLTVKVSP